MAKHKTGFIAWGIKITLLLVGVFYTLQALWGMCRTAMFMHESIVVQATVMDIRQRTFDSTKEALRHGNLSTAGDTAYLPIVAFRLPSGIDFKKFEISTPDNTPYTIGQQVELITYPYNPNVPEHATWQPEAVRVYKAKFLWGGDALLLLSALSVSGIAWLMLRRKTPRTIGPKAPQQRNATPKNTAHPRPQQRPSAAEDEPPFTLTADEPPPTKKKRAPRKKKTETAAEGDAPKKRKSTAKPRKKKAEAE